MEQDVDQGVEISDGAAIVRLGLLDAKGNGLAEDALTMRDEVHSGDEDRLITIGISGASRLLMIVHTEVYEAPDTVVVRRIGSRRAAMAERREYEQRQE